MLKRSSPRLIFLPLLTALLLGAHSAGADSLPDPLFFDNIDDYYEKVTDGQFERLLELHLLQYGSDPEWGEAWAAAKFDDTATMLAEYGSTSAKKLYAHFDFAANFQAADWAMIRYDHTQWSDGRFDLGTDRFDGIFWATPKAALVLSGWPTAEKSYVNFGLGAYLGRPGDDYGLYLLVRDDRWIHNEKAQDELRYTSRPIRYIAEGHYRRGPFFIHGSFNLGEPYRAEEVDADNGIDRNASGHLRYGDIAASWESAPYRLGLRAKFVDEQTRQTDVSAGEQVYLDRIYWRVDGYATKRWDAWHTTLSLGMAGQEDDLYETGELDGDYTMETWLFGLEGGYLGWNPFDLRLGYLGSVGDMEREVASLSPDPVLGDQEESGYTDKLQLRCLYSFGETFKIEAAVSKEIAEGSFGGGTIKAFGRF